MNEYIELRHDENLYAWNQDEPENGWRVWRVVRDGYKIAEVFTRTTRQRRRDLSGLKSWRVVVTTEYRVRVRLMGGNNFSLRTRNLSKGERTVVRSLLKYMFADEEIMWRDTLWDAEIAAREAGISESVIMSSKYKSVRIATDEQATTTLALLLDTMNHESSNSNAGTVPPAWGDF